MTNERAIVEIGGSHVPIISVYGDWDDMDDLVQQADTIRKALGIKNPKALLVDPVGCQASEAKAALTRHGIAYTDLVEEQAKTGNGILAEPLSTE